MYVSLSALKGRMADQDSQITERQLPIALVIVYS